MELSTNKEKVSKENLVQLLQANNIELTGHYSIEKLLSSIKNSYLVVSIWENDYLKGFCKVISDGVYYGRIQELILDPNIKDKNDFITDVLSIVFEKCANLKSFHLNPAVFEKKEIYQRKHFCSNPNLRKLYWSIHEDEF